MRVAAFVSRHSGTAWAGEDRRRDDEPLPIADDASGEFARLFAGAVGRRPAGPPLEARIEEVADLARPVGQEAPIKRMPSSWESWLTSAGVKSGRAYSRSLSLRWVRKIPNWVGKFS